MDTIGTKKLDDKYFLPASVIVAGLLIAGAVLWDGPSPSAGVPQPSGGQAPTIVNPKDITTEGAPFIGKASAPVTLFAWGDYQCPFCKLWETETLPGILKEYVEKGTVKIVFKDFAFLGPDSTTAAEYNHAIWNLYPDKYFAWRTAMYEAQDEEHGGFGNAASIDKMNATIPGIDAAKVAADVKANGATYRARMEADRAEAQKVGIGATPSFVVGTQVLVGARPYADFKSAIDAALKK